MTERPVDVEVVLLRGLVPMPASGLASRTVRGALQLGEMPDDAALRLAGLSTTEMCHSTSWRYEGGTMIVTYAALPDPHPGLPAAPLSMPAVLSSGDPTRPSPVGLHAHHVVAHAVRHLAYLAEHDPAIAELAAGPSGSELWAAIRAAAQHMPTGTHDDLLVGPHSHAHAGADTSAPRLCRETTPA